MRIWIQTVEKSDTESSVAASTGFEDEETNPFKLLTAIDFAQFANEKQYSAEEAKLRYLLKLPYNMVYTNDDLNDKKILERALQLLYAARTQSMTVNIYQLRLPYSSSSIKKPNEKWNRSQPILPSSSPRAMRSQSTQEIWRLPNFLCSPKSSARQTFSDREQRSKQESDPTNGHLWRVV